MRKKEKDICFNCRQVMKKRQCKRCCITYESIHKIVHREKARPKDKGLLAIGKKPRAIKLDFYKSPLVKS